MGFNPKRSATWVVGPNRALEVAQRLEQASLMLSKRLDILNPAAARDAWTLAKSARALAGSIAAFRREGTTPSMETWSSLRGRLHALELEADAFFRRPDLPDLVRSL